MANDHRDRSWRGEDRDLDCDRWRDDLDRDIRSREREREQWERDDLDRERADGGRADGDRYRYGTMYGSDRGRAWDEAPYRGESFLVESRPRERVGRSDYERDWQPWRDRGGMRDQHPSFRGRGPKGYQRSDERIREDVCECLAMDDHVDASEIEVKVSAAVVTLDGYVADRLQKRHAEDIVEIVSGVKDVENSLRLGRNRDEESSLTRSNTSPTHTATPSRKRSK